MAEIIETERVIIRHWELRDAQRLFEICGDVEVMRRVGDGKPFRDIERAKKFLESVIQYQKENGFSRWAVIGKLSGRIIGSCGFARMDNGEIDLGYLFAREVWGNGFATETARACVDYGFASLGLTKIVARADIDHFPSHKVLEKIGFKMKQIEKSETGDDWVFEIRN